MTEPLKRINPFVNFLKKHKKNKSANKSSKTLYNTQNIPNKRLKSTTNGKIESVLKNFLNKQIDICVKRNVLSKYYMFILIYL